MEDLEKLRQLLYAEINDSENLYVGKVLELSQKLDEIIVDVYKKELNINND